MTHHNDDLLSKEDIEGEEAYGKLFLATAIVMAACQDAGKDAHLLFHQYMLNDNFPAVHATPFMTLRTPSASAKPAKRVTAAKENRTSIPEPTAWWMAVVEEIPAILKNYKSRRTICNLYPGSVPLLRHNYTK